MAARVSRRTSDSIQSESVHRLPGAAGETSDSHLTPRIDQLLTVADSCNQTPYIVLYSSALKLTALRRRRTHASSSSGETAARVRMRASSSGFL
jgi:hypothetical protein